MLSLFASQSNDSRLTSERQRLVNYFARPSGAVSEVELLGASGVDEVANLGGPIREMRVFQGDLYAVASGALWRIIDGVADRLADLPDDPQTTAAATGLALAIVADERYFLWQDGRLMQYATGAVDTPKAVVTMDGYFIVIGSDANRGDKFAISQPDNGSVFDGFDFAFAESAPDDLVGGIVDHSQLWLIGASTIEIYYNSGDPDFPFQRNSGATIERGCLNGKTIAKEDNAVFWVGEDRVAYRSGGGVPEVISTREIEEVLEESEIELAFVFKDRGHKFYAIKRSDGTTFCYDLTTGLWHERSRGASHSPWSVVASRTVGSQQYVGTVDGKIGSLSPDSFSDGARQIVAEAISAPLNQGAERFSVGQVAIEVRTGSARLSRQPQIMLQVSRDGQTFEREKWRLLGNIGNRLSLARWFNLGQARFFQFKIKVSDPVQRDILGVTYQ